MNLQSIVDSLISNTVQESLPLFRPELALSVTIVVLLLTRVIPLLDRIPPFAIALVGSLVAFAVALPPGGLDLAAFQAVERRELFTGMLVYDSVTVFMRLFLTGFVVLFVILSRLTGIADRHDGQDYYALVFGATIGMCLMSSANHLLTLFLGVEMASVPSYVLAGIVKGRQRSSEASLKYVVYGAGAAGVMLYGASLLAGLLGSAHMPTMASRLIELDLPTMVSEGKLEIMVLALGGLLLGVGLAFKLSAVPFHFWCPDVFEGASAEVDGFLSVASKAAALALLIRVGIGFGYEGDAAKAAAEPPAKVAELDADNPEATFNLVGQSALDSPSVRELLERRVDPSRHQPIYAAVEAKKEEPSQETPLSPVRSFFVTLVGVVSIVTCTFGNLAAYGQRNIKRLFAYSTIAHAGFMMMPIAAAVAMMDRDPAGASEAVAAVLFYATIYIFMNLGAFAIVAFLRNTTGSEEIKDYAGLIGRSPMIAVSMVVILVSLIGIPPMAGFVPKFRVLQSLYEAGGPLLMTVMVVAAINTAISLVYYLRVAKTICIDPQPESGRPVEAGFFATTFILAMAAPIVVFGIFPGLVIPWTQAAATGLFG